MEIFEKALGVKVVTSDLLSAEPIMRHLVMLTFRIIRREHHLVRGRSKRHLDGIGLREGNTTIFVQAVSDEVERLFLLLEEFYRKEDKE